MCVLGIYNCFNIYILFLFFQFVLLDCVMPALEGVFVVTLDF